MGIETNSCQDINKQTVVKTLKTNSCQDIYKQLHDHVYA